MEKQSFTIMGIVTGAGWGRSVGWLGIFLTLNPTSNIGLDQARGDSVCTHTLSSHREQRETAPAFEPSG